MKNGRLETLLAAVAILSGSSQAQGTTKIRFVDARDPKRAEVQTRYSGDRTAIHVEGLQANETYRLKLTIASFGPKAYESAFEMKADSSGIIDTDRAAALSGSYRGMDVDGPFWSMDFSDAKPSREFQATVEKKGATLATASMKVGYLRPGVTTVELGKDTGLVGTLYLPATAPGTKSPVVITTSGSEGGTYTGMSAAVALANSGYAALALAYFGAPGVPAELKLIPLEYFEKAIAFLQSRAELRADQIAVMAPSRGGELSLLLGSTFPQIRAVVAQVPSPYRWGANVEGTPVSAWQNHGIAFPFLSVVGDLTPYPLPDGRTARSNRKAFADGLKAATPTQRAAALSPIEKTNGPILLLGASDDQVWPSCDLAQTALQHLRAKKHAFADEAICFPDAGHGISSVPGWPTTQLALEHPQMHLLVAVGGTPAGNASAQRKAWEKTLEFLHKRFSSY